MSTGARPCRETAGCRWAPCGRAPTSSWPSTTFAAATPSFHASSLSGGNQQKVCVAREIASNPRVLIAHQPTRGLDVGAIEFVHRRLVAERDRGRGILLVSLEFEEVRSLADRILVIYEGELVGEFRPMRPKRSSGSP